METYEDEKDAWYMSRLAKPIDDFAACYAHKPGRPIIFLFPGGPGSDLVRAQRPNTPSNDPEPVWLNLGSAVGAETLPIMADATDLKRRYVVPDGAVDFPVVPYLHPYRAFVDWCRNDENGFHPFVFGWDWRRGVGPSADFFLGKLLPAVEKKVPLDDFTIIGHSLGGMLVKAIANRPAHKYVKAMKRAITVSAPFYGYSGQIHRYLKGEMFLNVLIGGLDNASRMTRLISSMPGGYEFLYLDYKTYCENADCLKKDPEGYNLCAYPSMDWDTPTEPADPYNPDETTSGVRYPANYGFDMCLLKKGEEAAQATACKLDEEVANKFYCIRGVQLNAKGGELQKTVVGHRWKRIPKNFDPDHDHYCIEDIMGPGDGVQPAWTARLLRLPDNHVITVHGTKDDVEHQMMMTQRPARDAIATLMGKSAGKAKRSRTARARVPNRRDFEAFVRDMKRLQARLKGMTAAERRRYLEDPRTTGSRANLPKLFLSFHKTPSQLGEALPKCCKPRKAATKPAARAGKQRKARR